MKWSKWRDDIWGHQRAVFEPSRGTSHEITVTITALTDGWEVELFVDVLGGPTNCIQVRMRDLPGTREEAQEQSIAWADGVIEKLGAFLEVGE